MNVVVKFKKYYLNYHYHAFFSKIIILKSNLFLDVIIKNLEIFKMKTSVIIFAMIIVYINTLPFWTKYNYMYQPAKTHYGNPADGCLSDEMPTEISGMNGNACLPECNDNECPTDLPIGTTARPVCAIKDPNSDNQYCVLMCRGSISGTCPIGASCAYPNSYSKFMRERHIIIKDDSSSIGICTYSN